MLATTDTPSEHTRAWLSRNWKAILVLIVVGALLSILPIHFGLHLGYIERDKSETVKLIEQFHQRMNAGQFDQIYDDASFYLQRSATRETLIGAMRKAENDCGVFEKVDSSKINVVMGAPVEIRAVYDSRFEKGDATEWFVFVVEGRGIRLKFYDVQRIKSSSPEAINTLDRPSMSAKSSI